MRSIAALTALALAAGPALAGEPTLRRGLTLGGDGPNRLEVDVPLLVAAASDGDRALPGLARLRIHDAEGKEVPYLLIPPPKDEPRWVRGDILPIKSTRFASGLELDLGEAMEIDRLRLEGLPAPFLKRVQLEASGDREHWVLLQGEGTLFDLPDERLRLLDLSFTAGSFRYLRLTWDDRKSGRLREPRRASVRIVRRQEPPPPLRTQVDVERRPSEPGKSRYRVRLPGPRLPVKALELECGGGHILREARVTEGRLQGGRVTPVPFGSATLRRVVRDDGIAAELRIPISEPEGPDLDLVVKDDANPPLDLLGITAELRPLPWIYIEGSGGAELWASFAPRKTPAPRYDLEATRPFVAETAPSIARWEAIEAGAPKPAAAAAPGSSSGAPLDRSRFRYSRIIPDGPVGLTALRLDAAVLAHSQALGALRITDAPGRQIPYLFEQLDEPLELPLPALRREPETDDERPKRTSENVSRYALELPFQSLPPARLVLHTPARVFDRQVTVSVRRLPRDGRREPYDEIAASSKWTHAEPETEAPVLVLDLPALRSRLATVVIDEGDNRPLPIQEPKLLLPAYRLRFFRTGPMTLTLHYGAELPSPQYDLALLSARLLGASAHEVWPGAEETAPEASKPFALTQRYVFWAALVLAVIVLLALMARLLRTGRSAGRDAP